MKLHELRSLREADEPEDDVLPVDDTENQDAVPEDDEGSEESSEPKEGEDVGSVADEEGFKKSKKEMYAFGKTRPVTLLTKNESLGGLKLTLQYVINPQTGAWSLRACLAGQGESDMVEFTTGEDPSSLINSLRKKKKITPHQAVEFLNPPADQIKKDIPDDSSSEDDSQEEQ